MATLTDHAFPNGKPVLLDQYGKPVRPDGSAHPSGIALPHAWTFIARQGGAFNAYWHDRYDEALRHAREDAEVMRRDTYLMALLQERQLAVSGLPWHLEVPDRRDPYQRRVRDGLTQIVRAVPNLRRIIKWLLEAVWYGRYGVQVQWVWGSFYDRPGKKGDQESQQMPGMPGMPPPQQKQDASGEKRRCLTLAPGMWPVNGDKIGFQYDHTPYVLVGGEFADQLPDAEVIGTTIGGRGLTLRGTWRERFLLHRHLMEDVDFFNADQAAAVHGVGIRSKLFWLNWLKLEWLGNITDFFDRVGLGFTMWKYPAGNDAAKQEADRAARSQSSRAHVLVPVWGEGGKDALTGVERVEVPTSGSEALVRLVEYVDRHLERYVVGQSGSAKSSSSGIGNEAASEFLQATKGAITIDDAHLLGVSMTGTDDDPGLVSVIKRYTFPDADFPVNFVFDVERPESDKKLNAGKTLVDMGVKVSEDEYRAAGGYGEPVEGDKLVEPPQQGGPGMPGMPGAPPGDPAAGGMPGAPPAPPAGPPGDFLEALKMRRVGEPSRYEWQNKGMVRVSPTGKPLYRWYDPERRESRVQNVPPGHRGHKGDADDTAKPPRPGGTGLEMDARTRSRLAAALELMFPDGWVRPAGLPTLTGIPAGAKTEVEVRRDEDGGLVVALSADSGDRELTLHPDGVLSLSVPDKKSILKHIGAVEAAGVDAVFAGDDAIDLAAREGALPDEVREANEERRAARMADPDALMEEADRIVPRESAAAESETAPAQDKKPARPAEPTSPAKLSKVAQAVKYLKDTGRPEAARAAAIAYARLVSSGPRE